MELNFILGIVASSLTIVATTASGVRYLGREGAIRWCSDRLSVDLAGLALPSEDEPAARLEFLKEHFEAEELSQAAGELNPPLLLRHAAARASETCETGVLIELALEADGQPRSQRLAGHLSDGEVEEIIDFRSLWPDPIDTVAQLEDDPGHAYAWILTEDATEEDRQSLAREIEETFINMKASEPEALHFIVRSVDELRELDSQTVENYVKPWLKDSTNEEENK